MPFPEISADNFTSRLVVAGIAGSRMVDAWRSGDEWQIMTGYTPELAKLKNVSAQIDGKPITITGARDPEDAKVWILLTAREAKGEKANGGANK